MKIGCILYVILLSLMLGLVMMNNGTEGECDYMTDNQIEYTIVQLLLEASEEAQHSFDDEEILNVTAMLEHDQNTQNQQSILNTKRELKGKSNGKKRDLVEDEDEDGRDLKKKSGHKRDLKKKSGKKRDLDEEEGEDRDLKPAGGKRDLKQPAGKKRDLEEEGDDRDLKSAGKKKDLNPSGKKRDLDEDEEGGRDLKPVGKKRDSKPSSRKRDQKGMGNNQDFEDKKENDEEDKLLRETRVLKNITKFVFTVSLSFDKIDKDNSNDISLDEAFIFTSYFSKTRDLALKRSEKFIKDFDINQDSKISYQEFEATILNKWIDKVLIG